MTTTTTTAASPSLLLVRDGAIAGVVAAAATTLMAVAAKAFDVEMMAAPQTASAPEPLPMAAFAFSTLMSTALGILIALALGRWAPRPRLTWIIVAVVLTVISEAGPITTGHATTATRVVLLLTHVVAAAIIIPAIARRLPETDAR